MLGHAVDAVAGLLVRKRVSVRLGAGSSLRWRSLVRCRGGHVEIGEHSLVTPRRIDFDGADGLIKRSDWRPVIAYAEVNCLRGSQAGIGGNPA